MKPSHLLIAALGLLAPACAADPVPAKDAVYVDEAPLPKGWPAPGPYGSVSEKQLPAYRAAFAGKKLLRSEFWTLFGHIKEHGIPMTAPVEMGMEKDEDGLHRVSMGFLYQSPEVGEAGADGEQVIVRDIPAARVLSYTWQGPDSKDNIAAAMAELEKALKEKGVEAKGYRLLGYNGPRTPRARATWELQAILP